MGTGLHAGTGQPAMIASGPPPSASGRPKSSVRRRRWRLLPVLTIVAGTTGPAMAVETVLPCPDCPPLVIVPPLATGPFATGPFATGEPFTITRTEITFDQWQVCVEEGVCRGGQDDHGWGRGTRPVINISWDDANTFAGWLGARSGRICRLPTEAEWTHAARAGTTTDFWWGDDPGQGMANCRDCLGGSPPYGSRPVASFPANPWGLFDMNGNLWEWTATCWGESSTAECQRRVIKGGAWYYYAPMARARARAGTDPHHWSYTIGARIVCSMTAAERR